MNGLLLEGRLVVAPGNLAQLDLAHCAVVPGRGALEVAAAAANERLSIALDRCICAAISIADPIRSLQIEDSIVGDDEGSPDFSIHAPETPLELTVRQIADSLDPVAATFTRRPQMSDAH